MAVPRAPGAGLAVALALAGAACQLPPTLVSDAGLPRDGAGSDAAPPVDGGDPGDPFAARRAACAFTTGALVTETLPITETERAALPIRHVVVVMKENRSFDHLLGNLSASGQPDAEAIPASFANLDHDGTAVAPFHLHTTCVNKDPGHQWDDMHREVNGGLMDGFVTNGADTTGSDGHFVMGYYENRDLPFYYWLANTFAINDRHFASARSGTWPDRNFLLLGTADGVKSTYAGLPNPTTPTLFDSLDRAGTTWGVYTDDTIPFDGSLGWMKGHPGFSTFQDFLARLADGTLPSVAFVDSIGWVSDEHPTADVQVGEAWTKSVYDAAVASPLWPTMALIWTYDEGGGFADHVPPPNRACVARPGNPLDTPFVELGVRVPLVVISPYARPHHVSHVVQEHTAITRFIETLFGLPALTSRDANSPGLLDMFDFSRAPQLLQPGDAPAAGVNGCNGNIVLTTDSPSYASTAALSIGVSFRDVPTPHARDRLGVYKYGDVPTDVNGQEPIAWGYIGGQGHNPGTAPPSGTVFIDGSVAASGAAWPLTSGLWIIYYLPATSTGADGHTPAASVDFEID